MIKYVIRRAPDEKLFMVITNNELWWTPFNAMANWYASRYHAKRHVREIDLPDTIVIEPMENIDVHLPKMSKRNSVRSQI